VNDPVKSFTSWKLNLQKYLLADPRLKPTYKLIAICILHHLNIKTLRAFVSAEAISDETHVGVRTVGRGIRRLKDIGWLKSQKTSTANKYEFSDKNVNQMMDRLVILRDARAAKRTKKRAMYARTQASEHNDSART